MVRALLDGRKTQTRRVVKHQFDAEDNVRECCNIIKPEGWQGTGHSGLWAHEGDYDESPRCCPQGIPGDRLWVKETFAPSPEHPRCRVAYQADLKSYGLDNGIARQTEDSMGCVYPSPIINPKKPWGDSKGGWKPSIFMPRWASRITLEITGVRVDRLQEISEADAKAEGIEPLDRPGFWKVYNCKQGFTTYPKVSYESLWESINGPGSWEKNPWVWVIEFRKL